MKAIREAGRQWGRPERDKAPPLFGGVEIVLVVIAIAAAIGGAIGFIVAKKAPSAGQAVLIILAYCGLMFIFAYRKLMRR